MIKLQRQYQEDLKIKTDSISDLQKELLIKSEKLALAQSEQINQITGGDSYAYVEFTAPVQEPEQTAVLWRFDRTIVNRSKYPVFELSVLLHVMPKGDHTNLITEPLVEIGTLTNEFRSEDLPSFIRINSPTNSRQLSPIIVDDDSAIYFFVQIFQKNRELDQYTVFKKKQNSSYTHWVSATRISERLSGKEIKRTVGIDFDVATDGKITWSRNPLLRF